MTGDKSLDEILRQAQALPAGQRRSFLRAACTDEEMLTRASASAPWLDDPQPPESFEVDRSGELIGAYRLLRKLGQGGMGEVYLAQRADDQFQQQVAIKLVRAGLLSQQVRGRLRQERQILAALEHPHIARLYDGGTTADGTPYLVMEYVDGEPIDAYCERERLTIDARLRLFAKVCAAVHRAHQRLIVHRDLKPSNILVTRDGEPKLLDFGIAKLLDESEAGHTMALTQIDVRVMTPDHASPEQIKGESITTASDTYVLGVLLYELLTGHRPFDAAADSVPTLTRAICVENAPAPSAVIHGAMENEPDEIAEIAARRSTTPARLRRALRGDLDNIVGVAMRKEPERRYASAEQLARDIENHLAGMPVAARPDAWSYRALKFTRRHAAVLALAVLTLALLVSFATTTYLQSRQIAVERDLAQAQRVRAESERARAEAVSTFLIDSFRLADPARARGDAITAREILDSGARRIATELQQQPTLQATLQDTIGGVYLGLGLPMRAEPLIEEGLAIRRRIGAGADIARSLYSLSLVREKQGALAEAESLARQSLALQRAQHGERSAEAADGLCRLGYVERQQGELQDAERSFQQCYELRRAAFGAMHEKIAIPLDNLAQIAHELGDLRRAEQLLREAVAIDAAALGADHPRHILHLFHLTTVLEDSGRLAEAQQLYDRVDELALRVLGPEHPETIDMRSSMGVFLMRQGKHAEAERVLLDVLSASTKLRGPSHPYVGNDHQNLGRLAFEQNDFTAAETRLNQALGVYRQTLPPEHGLVTSTQTMLGRAHLAQNELSQAEAAFGAALDGLRVEYGEDSVRYALTEAFRARAWMLQGRTTDAERVLMRAYPLLARSERSVERAVAADVRTWIEQLYAQSGRATEAAEFFQRRTPAD